GLTIVPWVNPTGGATSFQTAAADAQSHFALHSAETALGSEPGTPGLVTITTPLPMEDGSFVVVPTAAVANAADGQSRMEVTAASTMASNALALAVVEQVFSS